jgi:hypothetical protein
LRHFSADAPCQEAITLDVDELDVKVRITGLALGAMTRMPVDFARDEFFERAAVRSGSVDRYTRRNLPVGEGRRRSRQSAGDHERDDSEMSRHDTIIRGAGRV